MKKIIIAFFGLNLLVQPTIQAQENGVYFGAIAGVRTNNFENHFAIDLKPSFVSSTIGAGSAWKRDNFTLGVDFIFVRGTDNNRNGDAQLIGFNNHINIAYNITKSKKYQVEPTLGFVISDNQLIIQGKNDQNFQNLKSNELLLDFGLNFKRINENGLFTGLKMGYSLPFSNKTVWDNKIGDANTNLKDNFGAFYIQLNIGGLLTL
ncbi:MAG: hypothetical protein ACXITV_02640 [Luteibaculaceae bacterium]